ncbi:ATP-binding protein [Variovorax fucosicus]|uniref:ATP-binding protein n=1 Tax=Variovorax fucosicus TaxID=3053517 RepID=UPI0025767F0F|nr:AAA family ATPase [Variovorax sp. J22G47]MDM0055102.1 AAA family ATPase [Variovorax sp. J22G47]
MPDQPAMPARAQPRAGQAAAEGTSPLWLRFAGFELNEADARLRRDGADVPLTPKAFGVLCALARRAPHLVTKDALLDAVWGHHYVSESVLKTTVSELRAAMADDARHPLYIETAPRRGYRFVAASAPASGSAHAHAFDAGPQVMPRAAPASHPTLIGRSGVIEALRANWRRAMEGQGRIVWIAGEAGVGKTTLIDHFASSGAAARVAHGQCVEQFGDGEPCLPVLEALGGLCRDDPALVALMRTIAPTWLLQMPWLCSETERETLRRELAGVGQERMLREFGELIERYTVAQPLLLVTEDLHWSDQATLRLIDHVARRRAPSRMMWLASLRLAEVIADAPPLAGLRHELKLHRLCEEILLDPFSEQELADYLRRRVPGEVPTEGFVRRLHRHTDGLPLFVANVMDDLVGRGAPVQADASAGETHGAPLPVPESLAGVIECRIARLPDEHRLLLEAASVCGVEFRATTLASVLSRDVAWVAACCHELTHRQQWLRSLRVDRHADGSLDAYYGFQHALYRHVFYQRISAFARPSMHLRTARSMQARGAPASELALHYELGEDAMAAASQCAAAAENALLHFAPTEAMKLTAHALEILLPRCPAGPERDELEMALLGPRAVAASQQLGITAQTTRAAFLRVQELSARLAGKSSRALELGLGWVFHLQGDYAQARALALRIDALAAERGDALLHAAACNLLGTTAAFEGDLVGSRSRLEEGLRAFGPIAHRAEYVPFIVDLGVSMEARMCFVLTNLGLIDQARAHLEAATARADALRQPYARMLVLAFAGVHALRLEQPERVRDVAFALEQTIDEHAIVEGQGPLCWLRGWALARLGQPDAGYELIRQGCERQVQLGRFGGGSAAGLGYAVEALMLGGHWREARAQLDEAFARAQSHGERLHLLDFQLLEGQLAISQGEPEAGRHALQLALAESRAQQALWLELQALVALCELAPAAAEDRAALKAACERLAEGRDTALAQRAIRLLELRG